MALNDYKQVFRDFFLQSILMLLITTFKYFIIF